MSKLIICADLHLHNTRQFSNRIDWLEVGINVFKQVGSYSLDNNNIPIIVLGDIVHLKDKVPNDVLNPLYDLITEYSQQIPFYLLVGTHDAVVASNSSLKVLDKFPNINVLKEPTELSTGNIIQFFIPYRKTSTEFIKDLHKISVLAKKYKKQVSNKLLLFIHQDINTAVYDNDYEIKNSVTTDLFKNFDHVFSGHMHRPQNVGKNITYVGALHQTKFDEGGNENSFIVYDSDTGTYERIRTVAPEFVVDEFGGSKDYKNKLLQLFVDSDVDRNEIRKILYKNGCLGVIFKEKVNRKVIKQLEINSLDNYTTILEKYISKSNYKNKDKLIKLGKEILEETND